MVADERAGPRSDERPGSRRRDGGSSLLRARRRAVHTPERDLVDHAAEPAIVLDLDEPATPPDDGEDAGHVEADHTIAHLDGALFGHSARGACRAARWIARRCLGR